MRSADRSCKTSRLTAKEFADAISNHYQTQTISDRQRRLGLHGRSWFASHTGSVAVRHKRRYVKLRYARRCPAPKFQSLCCTLPSVSCGAPSVKRRQNCPLSQVAVSAGCTQLHIYKFRVRLCTVYISHVMYNTRHTQRLCQYSRPRHRLLSYY
jgi:hypothetical protein